MSTSETTFELTFERSLYIGNHVACVLYGISIAIFCMSAYLWYNTNGHQWAAANRWTIVYGFALLSFWTISRFCNVAFGFLAWIDHRNDSGGPVAYLATHQRDPANVAGTFASIIGNWLIDGLLLYRCCFIWFHSVGRLMPGHAMLVKLVMAVPTSLFLASIALSVLVGYESARPEATFFRGRTVSFAVPYFTTTVGLNVILTILIAIPIILIPNKQNPAPANSPFAKVTTMMIESAALVTVSGVVFISLYAVNHPASFAFLQIWGSFAPLASFLIILRVAMGRAWPADTAIHSFNFDIDLTIATSPGERASSMESTNCDA